MHFFFPLFFFLFGEISPVNEKAGTLANPASDAQNRPMEKDFNG
jgi:hypothetical protein